MLPIELYSSSDPIMLSTCDRILSTEWQSCRFKASTLIPLWVCLPFVLAMPPSWLNHLFGLCNHHARSKLTHFRGVCNSFWHFDFRFFHLKSSSSVITVVLFLLSRQKHPVCFWEASRNHILCFCFWIWSSEPAFCKILKVWQILSHFNPCVHWLIYVDGKPRGASSQGRTVCAAGKNKNRCFGLIKDRDSDVALKIFLMT